MKRPPAEPPRTRPSHGTQTTLRSDAVELPGLRVVVTTPAGTEITAPLGVGSLVVGTSADCDLVVDDPSTSRCHCEVTLVEDGVRIRDLGSKNGTFLGTARVVEVIVPPGKRITIGGSTLVVRAAGKASVVPLSPSASFGGALGGSVVMRALFARLARAAETSETVLILGESGTGKEVIARAVHDASPRRKGPFAIFDCGAIVPSLVEAELFGYVKGAFTGADRAHAGLFEQAHGGTLFIDELGELPVELQPKLLRALEGRQIRRVGSTETIHVDVRVVAATHRDLRARVASGAFREDLYYRVVVVEAIVPPLRERRDDIPLIVERFLSELSPPRTLDDLPSNAMEMLKAHHWPGNVRELRNTVARLVLFPQLAAQAIHSAAPRPDGEALDRLATMPLREARELAMDRFEQSYLVAKLREQGGNVTRAAEAMGVTRQFVHRLMQRHGIRGGD